MSALFNSDNATEVVSDFVANMASSSLSDDLKITEENIKNYLGDPDTGYEGIFKTLLKEYQNDPQGEGQGEFHDIQHIDVTQKAYDNMVNAISNLYQ
ncbi:MAG: hypothetical protein MJ200_03200 [Mycoplasmoidaceae bacterium]|nr:hypothetical protein [Mycoplasmoidaceae bacterium]